MTSLPNPTVDRERDIAANAIHQLIENIRTVFIGDRHIIELAVTAMLAGGHLLLEDVPGTGKTTLARALAASINGTTNRIQCTADLLPGDITGVAIWHQRDQEFHFRQGPVFCNILLADELNRATPKAQSALLEAMAERHVTVDGVTHPLDDPFLVIATQNHLEATGTYPLPEAQLDRFAIRCRVGYPTITDTATLVRNAAGNNLAMPANVLELATFQTLATICRRTHISTAAATYIATLVANTRHHPLVRVGASPRAAVTLARLAASWATMHGRNYVNADDIRTMAEPCLAHRLVLDTRRNSGATGNRNGDAAAAIIADVIANTTLEPH